MISGDDENVPVWHTREAVSALKSWRPSANVVCVIVFRRLFIHLTLIRHSSQSFKEDPGEGHWYPNVLKNPTVQQFLDEALESYGVVKQSESFTLTVANPRECGSLHGWKIDHLTVPGR